MGVGSGQSRVADLALRVFGKVLHPEWFDVRALRRYVQNHWEADVRLIEGGHVVIWRCGGVALTEVLAGAELELPEGGLLFQSPIRQERSTLLRPSVATEYQACFAVERVDREVFSHLSEELALDARREGLQRRGQSCGRLDPAPLSRLFVESRPRRLSVQSFHTFPGERTILRVQSLFEVRA